MNDPQITQRATASITFGYKAKALGLKKFLENVPESADITVNHYKGDQREPQQTTLTASWDPTAEGQWGKR